MLLKLPWPIHVESFKKGMSKIEGLNDYKKIKTKTIMVQVN